MKKEKEKGQGKFFQEGSSRNRGRSSVGRRSSVGSQYYTDFIPFFATLVT